MGREEVNRLPLVEDSVALIFLSLPFWRRFKGKGNCKAEHVLALTTHGDLETLLLSDSPGCYCGGVAIMEVGRS